MQNETTNLPQDAADQLSALTEEAKRLVQEIEDTNNQANARLDEISADIDHTTAQINDSLAELDGVEKLAGDELDQLVMRRAEAVTATEED